MKKYPIYYEGKKYQVIWNNYSLIKVYLCKGIFKIPMILRVDTYFEIYDFKYTLSTDSALFNGLNPESPDYYIRQAELVVERAVKLEDYIKNIEQQEKSQKDALKEWDGVIK